MKQPNKPQANAVTTKVGRIRSDNDPLAPENVPNVEFIDISSNKPVDPTRYQIFQLPHQFLEWVLSKEPPRLDPENLKDTAPRGMPVHPKKLVPNVVVPIAEPATDALPESSRRLLPDSRIEAHEPVSPPRATTAGEQVTTVMTARRPVGVLTRWALSGKMPRRVKAATAATAATVACLLLILLWRHVDSGATPQRSPVLASVSQAADVALLAAPKVEESITNNASATSPPAPDSPTATVGYHPEPKAVTRPKSAGNLPKLGKTVEHSQTNATDQAAQSAETSNKSVAPSASVSVSPPVNHAPRIWVRPQ